MDGNTDNGIRHLDYIVELALLIGHEISATEPLLFDVDSIIYPEVVMVSFST